MGIGLLAGYILSVCSLNFNTSKHLIYEKYIKIYNIGCLFWGVKL